MDEHDFYADGEDPRTYDPEQLARMRKVVQRHRALRRLLGRDLVTDDHGGEDDPPWMDARPELAGGPEEAAPGQAVEVRGTRLDGVTEAAFVLADGRIVPAAVQASTPQGVSVVVPTGASGLASVWVDGAHGQAFGHFTIRITEPGGEHGRASEPGRPAAAAAKAK